ncbi:uncharacterized protein [Drosophila tropicalis]|uniref:uncharacterized protein n=1 Tax=Drosophila tropicalis TaxID=46794 RepID=UPI0035ABA339
MPNSSGRPNSNEDPNDNLIFQFLQQELFEEEELLNVSQRQGDRPAEHPPKYSLTDFWSVPPALESGPPALESRPHMEVLKSVFEKHHQQENQIDTEEKKLNNFECRNSIFNEIPPLLPPRRNSLMENQCPSYQQIFVNSGLCKAPQLDGQGYDVPFPYPKHISPCREQRALYIFSVVDKLVLQLEYCMNPTQNSLSLVAIENSVKSTTGAVPKSKPRHIQSSVESSTDVDRSSRQQQLKKLHQHQLTQPQPQHKHQQQKQQTIDTELDLDCEFGMEYIQKFRDNNVRSSKMPETAMSDKDEGISSDSGFSQKSYLDSPVRKPPMRLQTVWELPEPTRPCTSVDTKSLSLSSTSDEKHMKQNKSLHEPMKAFKLQNKPPILGDEESLKMKLEQRKWIQEHIARQQQQPKLMDEEELKEKKVQQNLEKEQTKLEQDEKTLMQKKEDQKPKKKKLQLDFHDSLRQRQLRRYQERQAIFAEIHQQGLMLERLRKDEKKRHQEYKRQLRVEQQQKLNRVDSEEEPNYYKIGVDSRGRTLILPSMPMYEQDYKKKMGDGVIKTFLPLASARSSLTSISTLTEHQIPLLKFDDNAKQKSGFQLEETPRNTSFANRYDMSKNAGTVSKMKSSQVAIYRLDTQRRVHPYVPCPLPKQVAPIPKPVVTLEEEKEESPPKKVDSELDSEEEDYSDTSAQIMKVFADPSRLPKVPDLSKASAKPNAAAVVYLLYQEDSPQIVERKTFSDQLKYLRKKISKERKKIWSSSDETSDTTVVQRLGSLRRWEKGHKKEQYPFKGMPQIQVLPKSGDFRSYFEIDGMSIMILERVAQLSYKKEFQACPRVTEYLNHFYRQRCLKDTTNFHWYVNEGFFPAHLLLEEQNVGVQLDKCSNKDIDINVLIYLKQRNVDNKCPPLQLTELMAYYMVTSYCRVLFENATAIERPLEKRFLLRSRFAISNIESFMLDLNLNVLEDVVDCHKLLQWALRHENRVRDIYEEVLKSAEDRADLLKQNIQFVMRTPNLEAFHDFYKENQFPRPDALAINPLMNKVRRYQLPNIERTKYYICPIAGCGTNICSSTLLAHFLSDHCRRLEELWLKDRMVYVFHPQSYPPDQIHCICCTALLPCKPTATVPYPKRVLNYDLAPHQLYFAEHSPCLLMYTQIRIDRLLGPSESENESESPKFFRPQRTLYVFWLGSSGDSQRDYCCELNIYGRDKTVPSYSPMKSIKMSKMLNVPFMMANYEGRYIAVDHDSMSAMTHNFRELIYIDLHYTDLHSPKGGD